MAEPEAAQSERHIPVSPAMLDLFRQMFDRERREDDARAIYRHMAQRPRCSR